MNRKKTTNGTAKKAAKKTYVQKKTPPKPRKITLDEFIAVTAENHAKTEAAIRGLSAENKKISIAFEGLVEENKLTAASIKQTAALIKEQSKNLGSVNNRLGTITELIVVPKLRHNMNALGHNFDMSEPDMKIRGVIAGRKEDITQVDLILRGPTEALAVEVKTRLRELHVREHLERLQDLRDHEDDAGIKGKKLFGAVVGVVIDDTAKKIAKENGLYIVKIHEEEGKLDIEKPETIRDW
jgi:hypothetical protein